MEMFNCPVLEPIGNLDAGEEMIDLFFKRLAAQTLLRAGGILAFTTVVIGIGEEVWLLHLFNRSLTTRTGVFATVSELETAVSAHELVFFFSGDHAVALSAADEPCERERAMCSRTRVAVATEERLDAVIFGLSD